MAERVRITLVCSVCDARNYRTSKATAPDATTGRPREPLTMKKYCPTCGKHTPHRESK